MKNFKIDKLYGYNMDEHRLAQYTTYPEKKTKENKKESFKDILAKLQANSPIGSNSGIRKSI